MGLSRDKGSVSYETCSVVRITVTTYEGNYVARFSIASLPAKGCAGPDGGCETLRKVDDAPYPQLHNHSTASFVVPLLCRYG